MASERHAFDCGDYGKTTLWSQTFYFDRYQCVTLAAVLKGSRRQLSLRSAGVVFRVDHYFALERFFGRIVPDLEVSQSTLVVLKLPFPKPSADWLLKQKVIQPRRIALRHRRPFPLDQVDRVLKDAVPTT